MSTRASSSTGDRCILLPGASGRGKTTLTAALSLAGFTYCSDEHAVLDKETLCVWPVPVSAALNPGALELLVGYDPTVRLPVHIREDDQSVRYLGVAPAGAFWERGRPVGWIIFPRYAPGVDTSLRPVGKGQALRWLMQERLGLRDILSKFRVERLVRWIGRTECLELPMTGWLTPSSWCEPVANASTERRSEAPSEPPPVAVSDRASAVTTDNGGMRAECGSTLSMTGFRNLAPFLKRRQRFSAVLGEKLAIIPACPESQAKQRRSPRVPDTDGGRHA